ncbi:hypothetical protein [Rhizobium leguminosarum]|uniref:Uncharacterized protein n=1 Tax=Rhizobium leguminosarum TaxID=384 RepID=A0A7K3VRV7_RHILE|nr:hypothetical protein [Rhizobium leguminosarum]NEK19893.1 hypothetical protein [Rhizobium leguminosarum]
MSDPEVIHLPSLDPLYLAVGNGLNAFIRIEGFVAMLYATLMEPAPRLLSILSIDAATHVETKCRIISSVAPYRLERNELKLFNALLGRVKRKADFRNKLAHWQVGYWHKNMPVGTSREADALKPRLMPAYFTAGNIGGKTPESIRPQELQEFFDACLVLQKDLLEFNELISRSKDEGNKPRHVKGRSVSKKAT